MNFSWSHCCTNRQRTLKPLSLENMCLVENGHLKYWMPSASLWVNYYSQSSSWSGEPSMSNDSILVFIFLELSSCFVSWIHFTVTFITTRDLPGSSSCQQLKCLSVSFTFILGLRQIDLFHRCSEGIRLIILKSHLYRYIAILTDLPGGTGLSSLVYRG